MYNRYHQIDSTQVEVGEPDLDAPGAGRVEVCVSCSNSLFPKFDDRSSGDVNAVLSGALERSMRGVGGKSGACKVVEARGEREIDGKTFAVLPV